MKRFPALLLSISLLALVGCKKTAESSADKQPDAPTGPALFTLLSPDQTGVTFSNNLTEGLNTNVLMYEYFYNGGGVAVGDLNNDGLDDIYFTANMAPNKLYLNKGKMRFVDITAQAGAGGEDKPWKTGVTMADVNGDGKLDIYISRSGTIRPENRLPELLINDGPDAQGIPHFTNRTAEYGLAQPVQSTQGVFFDYDHDGDLDLFQLNHNPRLLPILDPAATAAIMKQTDPEIGVRLYQNTGNHFTDVTAQSGLSSSPLSYGLGVGVSDLNSDGWSDLYISNDYGVPDYLYINQRGKSGPYFKDVLKTSMGHTSNFSMGNAVADVNNDARPDVLTLDMLPEDNRRQKLLMAPDNYEKYDLAVQSGFHHQIMRNMLQINNGDERSRPDGSKLPTYREVGQLAGIANTDWSWSPLLADYDNDGWKDLYVTNGYVRDYTNQDYVKFMNDFMQNRPTKATREDVLELVHKMPASNVTNYLFRNRTGDESAEQSGEVRFADIGKKWGMTQPSNSTGAAYADLDNDGDLDLIVNNTNQTAFIYQNEAQTQVKHHYLTVALKGNRANTQGLGAKLMLYQTGRQQYQEQMPTRGYQSSMSPLLHFGLGADSAIDSLRIVWPSGKAQLLMKPKADQKLTLNEADAHQSYSPPKDSPTLFVETKSLISRTYSTVSTNDFKRQPLLVNAQSFGGPCLAKGDINGDGLDDVYAGGTSGESGMLYIQQATRSTQTAGAGQFSAHPQAAFEADKQAEDTDALFFDANGDGKLDLYVCSGGYGDLQVDDARFQDRLYLNDGKGNFTKAAQALPVMRTSKSCVRATDLNGDGRLDLFVGGRVIPGRYPEAPRSYVLINTGKGPNEEPLFVDQTTKLAPALARIGMVTDAAWTDLNADHKPELVLVGEWMPITVMSLVGGQLIDKTTDFLPKEYRGWWNKLLVDDLNGDGRPDLVIGNQGLNTQCRATDSQPAELVYKDFDNNGKIDPILCLYVQGKSYPHATRDELLDQLSMLRPRFTSYDVYSNATLTDIFSEAELKDTQHLTANQLQTTYLVSSAGGKLMEKALPLSAQVAPVFTVTSLDYNHDGHKDLLLCGNATKNRIRFGRSDANMGVLLRNDGRGGFIPVPTSQTGFQLTGDVRSVLSIGPALLVGINQQPTRAYKLR